MPMTPKEKMKLYRERKRNAEQLKKDKTYDLILEPFHVWLERTEGHGDWSSALWHFDAAGIDLPDIADDLGPRSLTGEIESQRHEGYDPYSAYVGSAGQADSMIDNIVAGAQSMAVVVSRYKLEQVDRRIADLEKADFSDPETRKQTVDEMVFLTNVKSHLERQVRLSFHQWRVKEI